AAMAALDDASRGHEEYRLRLAAEKEIRLAGLDVQRQVAEAQATVLATGLENADIDIVGGDSVFFDRLVSSISMGKSLDGFVSNSDTAKTLAGPWLNGDSSFTEDLTRVLSSVSTGDVQNLTVSALLMRMMAAPSSGVGADQVRALLDHARSLGLADVPVSGPAPAGLNGTPVA
ncbi:flotillin family protein, partial [Streptomyces sp. DT225]